MARGILRLTVAALAAASPAFAQMDTLAPGQRLNFYGLPGLVDMPTAGVMPDGELAGTIAGFQGTLRGTLSFQFSPRLAGTFRYARVDGLDPSPGREALFDRSFDLQFRFLDEGDWWPALAVGLRDLGGTGLYSSEYIVATRHFGTGLAITAGIGWGRLATRGAFDNPLSAIFGSGFDTRPEFEGTGGEFSIDQWFRGPAALFGGIEWSPTKRLTLVAEYASDAYTREAEAGTFAPSSPFSFGARYALSEGTTLGLHAVQGEAVALSAVFTLNPKRPAAGGLTAQAPVPVMVRPGPASGWSPEWIDAPGRAAATEELLVKAFALEGLGLERLELAGTSARVGFRNERFDSPPMAIGRASRILAAALPPAVETFVLEPLVEGMATARVTLRRSDIEALEFAPDAAGELYRRARIEDAGGSAGAPVVAGAFPRLTAGISPYVATRLFDPDSPLRLDFGLESSARLRIAPGLSASGALRFRLTGNLDTADPPTDASPLPPVRTDGYLYDEADWGIEYLTLDYFARPDENLYLRLSAGYFEKMYGGVSAEVLWKPPTGPLALGAEVNYARQRDYDKLFGFRDYDVITGHVSAYYRFSRGYEAQLDIGRYLAGDVGATLTIDRVFNNGWRVGAFATLTDVSFEDFGEGSFDKGIRVYAPLSWFLGRPNTTVVGTTLRPIQRDGGARLIVRNRLYPLVSDYTGQALADEWGLYWR
jgi:hypothetical protein